MENNIFQFFQFKFTTVLWNEATAAKIASYPTSCVALVSSHEENNEYNRWRLCENLNVYLSVIKRWESWHLKNSIPAQSSCNYVVLRQMISRLLSPISRIFVLNSVPWLIWERGKNIKSWNVNKPLMRFRCLYPPLYCIHIFKLWFSNLQIFDISSLYDLLHKKTNAFSSVPLLYSSKVL